MDKEEIWRKYQEEVGKCDTFLGYIFTRLNEITEPYKGEQICETTEHSLTQTLEMFIQHIGNEMVRERDINPQVFKNHCYDKYSNLADGDLFIIDEYFNTVTLNIDVILYRIIQVNPTL